MSEIQTIGLDLPDYRSEGFLLRRLHPIAWTPCT
jgi:hypothetical protein